MLPIGHRMTALLLAAGSVATAQDCFLTTVPASQPGGFLGDVLSAYDSARSRILVVEQSPSAPLKLYAWTGTTWTLLSANGPTPRTLAAMVYDSGRDRLVLHGGLGTQPWFWYPPEVWEWDGQSWTSIPVEPGLLGRRGHAMVYDAARQNTFMFGGRYDNQVSNEVWLWDGVAWFGPNPLVRPSPRQDARVYFNPQNNTVLLFGGYDQSFNRIDDLWQWDGQVWTRLPDPPIFGSRIYNPGLGRWLVLTANQAWDFDGATYTFVAQFGPSSLRGLGLAVPPLYDVSLSRVVFPGSHGLRVWNPQGSIVEPWIASQPTTGGVHLPGVNTGISVDVQGTGPMSFQWFKDGVPLSNGGHIGGAQSTHITFTPVSLADTGFYSLFGQNPCGSIQSNNIFLSVQACLGGPCYANCDESTGCPALTANDFLCYLNKFVSGHPYANCDGSTGTPTLTAGDYQCFLNKFAAGCS